MSKNDTAKQLAPYIANLTNMQRIFVLRKLEGATDVAAATAAGMSNPKTNAANMKRTKGVQQALEKGMEILAGEALFTRKQAHDMYMEAYRMAENATEQVKATDSLVKLHGLAAPEVKEIHQHMTGKVEHHQVAELTDEQLLKLAQLPTEKLPQIIEGEYDREDLAAETDGGAESGEDSVEEAQIEETQSHEDEGLPTQVPEAGSSGKSKAAGGGN